MFELDSGFDRLYGLEILDVNENSATAKLEIVAHHKQPFGYVHGGVLASIGETLASVATWAGVNEDGKAAFGQTNSTTFLRPVSDGTVYARATRRHRGRTTWVWDIDITDEQDRLCATTRMTVAVR